MRDAGLINNASHKPSTSITHTSDKLHQTDSLVASQISPHAVYKQYQQAKSHNALPVEQISREYKSRAAEAAA